MPPGTTIEPARKWCRFHHLTANGSYLTGLYFGCIVCLVQVVFSFPGRADSPAQTFSFEHCNRDLPFPWRPAHTLTIPALKIGTPNEPPPVCVLVGCYTPGQDESKDCGRMHLELADCFACGENFHSINLRLLLAQHIHD